MQLEHISYTILQNNLAQLHIFMHHYIPITIQIYENLSEMHIVHNPTCWILVPKGLDLAVINLSS